MVAVVPMHSSGSGEESAWGQVQGLCGAIALDGAAGPQAPPRRAGSKEDEDQGPARYIPVKAYFLSTR